MAQSGYTPISLYFSTTASAVPTAANLAQGELAINIADGKLYYENSSGVVTLLASATTVTNSFSAGTTGLTPNTATTGAVTLAGTLAVANGGTGLSSGTSGGVLAYTATGTLASSAALAASALVIGGGAGAAPSTTTTGTGVVTALGVNVGTAGAFVVNGGALGTPSSGTVTNLTGTASININGTVGATTPAAGAFSTVTATGSIQGQASNAFKMNSNSGQYYHFDNATGSNFMGLSAANVVDLYAGGALSATFRSTGLAVTGTLSATDLGSAGNTVLTTVYKTGSTGSVISRLQTAAFASSVLDVETNDGSGSNYRFSSTIYDSIISNSYAGANLWGNLNFATGGVIRAIIVGGTGATAGNVGIGTTSPAEKLSINGTLSNVGLLTNFTGAAKTVNAGSNVRLFQTNEAVNYAALQGSFVGAATAADRVFRFQTVEQGVANDGIISFQPDGGNVGIGTTSPTTKLQIGTGTTAMHIDPVVLGLSTNVYYNGSTYVMDSGSAMGSLFQPGNGDFSFRRFTTSAVGSYSMYIDTSGNVGIGTSSPARQLSVSATSDVGIGMSNSTSVTSGNRGTLSMDNSANSTVGFIRFGAVTDNSGTDIQFAVRPAGGSLNSTAMKLDSSGNLLVGTTSNPGTRKVSVVGSIASTFSDANDIQGVLTTDANTVILAATYGTTGSYKPFTIEVGGSTRIAVTTSGIVTMSAYGVGTATFSATGVISSVSDETWKIKDGVPVDTDSMLKKLEPGYWYYNDEKKETFGVDRQLGFYAQNVNAAIGPEAAPTPEEGKPWGYYDRSVLAITVMSLQKALATIETLTARITALETA